MLYSKIQSLLLSWNAWIHLFYLVPSWLSWLSHHKLFTVDVFQASEEARNISATEEPHSDVIELLQTLLNKLFIHLTGAENLSLSLSFLAHSLWGLP